jgi:hypothetical protein
MLALAALMLLGTGCSRYGVDNVEREWDPETGNLISEKINRIANRLPAGARDASLGSMDQEINADGSWKQSLGQQSEADLSGTAAMTNTLMDSLIGALTSQTSNAALAQAQAEAYRQGLTQMQQQMQQLQGQLNQLRTAMPPGEPQ